MCDQLTTRGKHLNHCRHSDSLRLTEVVLFPQQPDYYGSKMDKESCSNEEEKLVYCSSTIEERRCISNGRMEFPWLSIWYTCVA